MTDLAELTTIRVGGPAREIVRPSDRHELVEAVATAIADGDRWLVLGGGSNVVAPDEGLDATAILTGGVLGIESIAADDGRIHLRVAAGERWDRVVAFCVDRGLAGIEALSGIPGSAGAAPVQNIGAYGQEIGSVLHAIEFYDTATGEVGRLAAAELELGYRTSALKRGREGVVVSVELALTPARFGAVGYEQLASSLGVSMGATVPLELIREAVLELRRSKGMLDDGALPSCGSFFVNPIVDENWARSLPADAPRWPVGPQEADISAPIEDGPRIREYAERRDVKLSAAWLIEQSGITRGFALPGSKAAISPKHTLAIVNTGGATAREIVQLAEFVQLRVSQEFGITLRPEPVILTNEPAD
ncbi:MAG TPA: UDP-N-acetylmuramate dehydrogenase [Microbacteriaceae bacterium]|nr:UDP-N-acetylmuramate dehydrogenase [Microbacteriaceae bacterium]